MACRYLQSFAAVATPGRVCEDPKEGAGLPSSFSGVSQRGLCDGARGSSIGSAEEAQPSARARRATASRERLWLPPSATSSFQHEKPGDSSNSHQDSK